MAKEANTYHHGDLRRALLQSAVELVAEVGVPGLSLREVARRAGVTHAAPYRHFPSKESLVAALAEDGFRLLVSFMEEDQAQAPPHALQRMQAAGYGYLRFAVTHPAHFRLMFGATGMNARDYPSLIEATQAAFLFMLNSIQLGQASGDLVACDPRELSMAAWSGFHGLACLWIEQKLNHLMLGDLQTCAALLLGRLLKGLGKDKQVEVYHLPPNYMAERVPDAAMRRPAAATG